MQSPNSLSEQFNGLRVVVTGAAGTVGSELVRQLLALGCASVIALDSNESELFFVGEQHRTDERVVASLADIRDEASLIRHFEGADLVLHAAALKHVPLCERSPMQAVQTNVMGTQAVLDAATRAGVPRVLFTSTDKAVNPTNVMGTSKLMAERLVTAHSSLQANTVACSTRFGNVLGSRGSVLPLFARQIRQGGPVTLTSPEMTRFIMTLEDAVGLVLESCFMGVGGEVFITKMPIARIEDLAHVLIGELADDPSAIEVTEIGVRPGEKMYEELMNDEEIRRSRDIGSFLVVHPTFLPADSHAGGVVDRPYNSSVEPAMNRDDLRSYLVDNDQLGDL